MGSLSQSGGETHQTTEQKQAFLQAVLIVAVTFIMKCQKGWRKRCKQRVTKGQMPEPTLSKELATLGKWLIQPPYSYARSISFSDSGLFSMTLKFTRDFSTHCRFKQRNFTFKGRVYSKVGFLQTQWSRIRLPVQETQVYPCGQG